MDPSHKAWERMTLDEVKRLLAVQFETGLRHEEVRRRLELYGRNEIERTQQDNLFRIFGKQFKSPLVIVLLVAGIATLVLGEHVDSIVIFIALAINVTIGTFQEERAGKAFETLNASQERHAIVIREGKRENILANDLVPGDIILLEGGYIIPADARILEEKDLRINESALTGEWLAVEKHAQTIQEEVPLAEKANMVWMGTLIEAGFGKAVVVATGAKTQLGEIAESLGSIENQVTPLQKNIRKLGNFISVFIAITLFAIFVIGLLQNQSFHDMLFLSIAVAVAAIPVGLPAALTIVLAIGMETILKRGGLVRNLVAAETLGSTTIILTDKTGTLTEAHMKLTGLYSYEGVLDGKEIMYGDNAFLMELGVLESDAFIEEGPDAPNKLTVHGSPIEKALVLAGLEVGLSPDMLLREHARLSRLKFSSERRFGVTLHTNPKKTTNRLIIAGEPETLLQGTSFVRLHGKREKMTDEVREKLHGTLRELASQGKRMIAITYRDASIDEIPEDSETHDQLFKQTVFAGFISFEDPIRTDVSEAIRNVQGAGAHVIMLTGDNPETAHYIAEKVGIIQSGDELVIRGSEIDQWDDTELYTKLQVTRVIARATPAHKLRIANILKRNGEVVAMTGDGINDAPALRAASIGVAVGTGTEVAKESSDLILIGNSFSVIVAAVEEGRRIIDNLKKIVAFLLSTSFSEIILLLGALATGSPIPLLPVQILWANIVGGDLVSFSYAFEEKDPTAMKRDPRSARSKNIMTSRIKKLILTLAVVSGATLTTLYFVLLHLGIDEKEIRTMMFVTLSLDSIFFSLSLKSFDTPIWRIRLFNNMYLLGALGISLVLLFGALMFGPLQRLLSLVPLTPTESGALVLLGLLNLLTIELAKYLLFIRPTSTPPHAAPPNVASVARG